jgi:hypothetical protein
VKIATFAKCPVCQTELAVRPAEGRKSRKPFIMVVCPVKTRHFRGFIAEPDFVARFIEKLDESKRESEALR